MKPQSELKGIVLEKEQVILDPSLLAPPSHDLTEGLLNESHLSFIATPSMLEVLGKHDGILGLWGIVSHYRKATLDFIKKMDYLKKVKILDVPSHVMEMRNSLDELILSNVIEDHNLADFIADEMGLALAGYPILCTGQSNWKIVEFFEKIGGTVKKRVSASLEEKGRMLQTGDFRKWVLARGLGAALVFVLTGPLAAFSMLGASTISLVIING